MYLPSAHTDIRYSRSAWPSMAPLRLLYPLDAAYRRAGIDPPSAHAVAAEAIPPPYRSLLVHENDMTVTLERYFGGRIVLRPLGVFTRGRSYFRRVLLVHEETGQPVEMGAIRIRLDAFDAALRGKVLRNEVPLGRILRDGRVDCRSVPKAFLEIAPNPEIMGVFWMREARPLYGRRTEIVREGRKIGDIVEILPQVIR